MKQRSRVLNRDAELAAMLAIEPKPADDLTPAQVRAARAFLGWTQGELAKAAGTGAHCVVRAERESVHRGWASQRQRLRAALEAEGLRFVDGGVGPRSG